MRGVCREEAGLMRRRVQSYFCVPDVQQDYGHIQFQRSANARLQDNNPIHISLLSVHTFEVQVRGKEVGLLGRMASGLKSWL